MLKDLIKYVALIDNRQLKYLVDNNLGLMQYRPTYDWITNNLGKVKFFYKFSKKEEININEILEEGRKYNQETYIIQIKTHFNLSTITSILLFSFLYSSKLFLLTLPTLNFTLNNFSRIRSNLSPTSLANKHILVQSIMCCLYFCHLINLYYIYV